MVLPIAVIVDLQLVLEEGGPCSLNCEGPIWQLIQVVDGIVPV
jgi:hypothetical protein